MKTGPGGSTEPRPSQRRVLGAIALVDSFGDGLYLAGAALFFTRGLGLDLREVGLGLTIAGVAGVVLSPELGRAADRWGARRMFVVYMTVQAVAVSAFIVVNGLLSLVATASVAVVCRQGAQASRGGIIALIGGEAAPELRSYTHAAVNVGLSLGAGAAGFAIAADTHAAYMGLMLTNAGTFLAAAAMAVLLDIERPSRTDRSHAQHSPRVAVRDKTFVILVALSVLLSLQFVVSGYLLPLWISLHSAAPRWFGSPLLLVNTGIIVALQVRFGRSITTLNGAATSFGVAGIALAISFAVFGSVALTDTVPIAVVILVVAMVVHSAAELLTVAASSVASFRLADNGAMSEYQGLWSLGFGSSVAIGPSLLTYACLSHGMVGWILIGLLMAVVGAVMGAVVRHDPRSRRQPAPQAADATASLTRSRVPLAVRPLEGELSAAAPWSVPSVDHAAHLVRGDPSAVESLTQPGD